MNKTKNRIEQPLAHFISQLAVKVRALTILSLIRKEFMLIRIHIIDLKRTRGHRFFPSFGFNALTVK
nr:hypothetical transcript [Hymenolepis microstoma]